MRSGSTVSPLKKGHRCYLLLKKGTERCVLLQTPMAALFWKPPRNARGIPKAPWDSTDPQAPLAVRFWNLYNSLQAKIVVLQKKHIFESLQLPSKKNIAFPFEKMLPVGEKKEFLWKKDIILRENQEIPAINAIYLLEGSSRSHCRCLQQKTILLLHLKKQIGPNSL